MRRRPLAPAFHQPALGPAEARALALALRRGQLHGNGELSSRVQARLQRALAVRRAFLTPSGTAALELALLALGVGPGDEVILPSFTFVSDANAVLLRGARPVFADVGPGTLNLDPASVRARLNRRTRAIILVHYAGLACDMDAFLGMRRSHGIALIEDAALAYGSTWRGRPLGSLGDLGCFSFHATKQIVCGEGGALVTSDRALARRIELMQEKGTDRSAFLRGERDRYTWRSMGSSYLLSDLLAAVLEAQLIRSHSILGRLRRAWDLYQNGLRPLERAGLLSLAEAPSQGVGNGSLFWLLLQGPWSGRRDAALRALRQQGVQAAFHYVPLHSSPFGRALGGRAAELPMTQKAGRDLLRLPLHAGLSRDQIRWVLKKVGEVLTKKTGRIPA